MAQRLFGPPWKWESEALPKGSGKPVPHLDVRNPALPGHSPPCEGRLRPPGGFAYVPDMKEP